MTASALACPRCGAPMVRLIASGGEHDGEPIWSCATYPTCRGTIAISDDLVEPVAMGLSSAAGSPPHARRRAERMGRAWPAAFGVMLVAILLAYLLAQAFFGPA